MFLPFWKPCTVTEANTLHLCKRLGYNYSWQAASCSKLFACDSLGLHAKRKRRLHRDIKARDVKWLQYRPGCSFKTNSAGLCGYSKASKSYFCFSEDYCSCQYEPMQMCPSEQKGEFIDCWSAAKRCCVQARGEHVIPTHKGNEWSDDHFPMVRMMLMLCHSKKSLSLWSPF